MLQHMDILQDISYLFTHSTDTSKSFNKVEVQDEMIAWAHTANLHTFAIVVVALGQK